MLRKCLGGVVFVSDWIAPLSLSRFGIYTVRVRVRLGGFVVLLHPKAGVVS